MRKPAIIALLALLGAVVLLLHSPFASHPSGCHIKVTEHKCPVKACSQGDTYEIEFNFNY